MTNRVPSRDGVNRQSANWHAPASRSAAGLCRTPKPRGHRDGSWVAPERGFTLIELILVMAMLLVVLSLAAPSLSRFFRGRDLDLEVRRFLGLTRYGQSRAVSEGVPMILWLDEEQRRYGLEAEFSYLDEDDKAVEFEVDPDVKMEVAPLLRLATAELDLPQSLPPPRLGSQRPSETRSLVMMRFAPTGFLTDSSPPWVAFRSMRDEDADRALWVTQSRNRLRYEIWTNEPPILR